jgi:hypothetical protein
MYEIIRLIIAAAVGGSITILGGLIAARKRLEELEKQFQFKIKELEKQFEHQQTIEQEREKAKIRIQYLNPLRVSATDLLERISAISSKIMDDEARAFLKDTFNEIKIKNRDKKEEFASWCNSVGYYAMSTLYITTLYYSRASKIRSELPFIELGPVDDQALLDNLSAVRKSFGGEYNIWETIQDSLGSYIRKTDGGVMNYREFCQSIIDKSDHIWFLRLIDFYRDIHLKSAEISRIAEALSNLIRFLKEVSKPRAGDLDMPLDSNRITATKMSHQR